MIVYRLSDAFLDEEFELIAIHTTLADYRLVYFLNKTLKINLYRNYKKQIKKNSEETTFFSYYEWYDEVSRLKWHCVANKFLFELPFSENLLFDSTSSIHYLIDTKKKVDFFLKIDTEEGNFNQVEIIKKLHQIPFIIKAYLVDVDTLSQKQKLIFREC